MTDFTRMTTGGAVVDPTALASFRDEPAIRSAEETNPAGLANEDRASAAYRAKAALAAEKFEAHFIAQMFRQIRRSTRELASDDDSIANRSNQDMLEVADNLVADSLASRHAFGIADVILRQLLPPADATRAADGLKESLPLAASSK